MLVRLMGLLSGVKLATLEKVIHTHHSPEYTCAMHMFYI